MKTSIKIVLCLFFAIAGINLSFANRTDKKEIIAEQTIAQVSVPSDSKITVQKGIATPSKAQNETVKNASTDSEKAIPANAPFLFWSQLVLLLVIIYFGIKYGGIALGMLGGLGVTLLVFLYGVEPGKPPVEVMLIILAVVTTSSSLEATGALNLIVSYAEKLLRKNPNKIVFLAPLTSFTLTMLVGTGHAVYPLLPVIYDVSIKNKIRPERPMAMAAICSQLGITASPISAAAAALVGIFAAANLHVSLIDILKITIPSGLAGLLLAALWSLKRGKDLENDPIFQEKIKDEEQRKYIFGDLEEQTNKFGKKSKTALALFLLGILGIVIIAIFPEAILPLDKEGNSLKMSIVLQFVMLAVGAIILFATKISAKSISDTKVFNAGMVAAIMIFGIAWMSDTVIENNKPYILSLISETVTAHPWTFALAMFCASAFLKSQAATLLVIMPLGISLGIPTPVLIACIPASYAYFFFCFYPSDLAAINFDRSGTTKAGSWILNHSFMIPGMIAVWTAVIVGFGLVELL